MSAPELTIQVGEADGRIDVGVFVDVVRTTLKALQSMDRDLTGGRQPALKWRIVNVKMESPLELTVQADAPPGRPAHLADVSAEFLRTAECIDRDDPLPPHVSRATTRAIEEIGRAMMRNGTSRLAFAGADGRPVVPSPGMAAKARRVLHSRPKFYTAETELRGRLGQVTVYAGKSEFQLFDPVTAKGTPCHFGREHAEAVGALITHRIKVVGTAKYNRNDELLSIQVREYEPLKEDNELPTIDDLHSIGINITGDQSSDEFIRGLRDGE